MLLISLEAGKKLLLQQSLFEMLDRANISCSISLGKHTNDRKLTKYEIMRFPLQLGLTNPWHFKQEILFRTVCAQNLKWTQDGWR